MKFFLLFVLCVISVASAGKGKKEKEEKLKVAVYYEALCPDSKSFITKQLYPAWENLRGVIRVKLVPYGKAIHNKKDGKWEFDCQHGPRECYGNKIQGCALKSKDISDEKKFDFVNCLMSQKNPDKETESCANKLKIEAGPIIECANSTKGDDILAAYGDKTNALSPKLSFVPTVVFNEKFNQDDQNSAMTDIKAVICRLAPKKPSQCS